MNNSLKNKAYDFSFNFIVALDGPSASGKGTLGKKLAEYFKLYYFQTSILYRKVAAKCLEENLEPDDMESIIKLTHNINNIIDQEFDNLYEENVTRFTSNIAAIPNLREILNIPQRNMIKLHPRIILDGRDIGTVIAPQADLKLFITAGEESRAERRYLQFLKQGKTYNYVDVLTNIKERDQRDSTRAASPALPAENAIIIDTTNLDVEEAFNKVLHIIDSSN